MDFKHLICLFTKEGKWYLHDCLTLRVNLVITYLDLQYKDTHKTFWSTFCYNKPSLYSIIMWGSPITSLCEGSEEKKEESKALGFYQATKTNKNYEGDHT